MNSVRGLSQMQKKHLPRGFLEILGYFIERDQTKKIKMK